MALLLAVFTVAIAAYLEMPAYMLVRGIPLLILSLIIAVWLFRKGYDFIKGKFGN